MHRCTTNQQMQRKPTDALDQKESEDQKIVCEESDRDNEKSKKSRGPQRPAECGQEAADVDEKSRKRLEAADGQRGI